jgi:hypothetical protein
MAWTLLVCESDQCTYGNIHNIDIVDHNPAAIERVLWAIVKLYQLQTSESILSLSTPFPLSPSFLFPF